LKKRLKGRRHKNIEAQAAATMELTGLPKEAFTSFFQDLQKRWQQYITYYTSNFFFRHFVDAFAKFKK
jgi:hypothetical protein